MLHNSPLLEVIATSPEDAIIAEAAGANRIELISAQSEGGLTPSLGMIQEVVSSVSIPVHVMLRPHSRNFRYEVGEINSMLRDAQLIANTRAAALVLGVLDDAQHVDTQVLSRLLSAAPDIKVTFHRAIDEAADIREAIITLSQYPQITRILTSGGRSSVLDAADEWSSLQQLAEQHHITLLAGAGLTLDTLGDFVRRTDVREVHLGSAVRCEGNIALPLDPQRIRQARQILDEAHTPL
ncbi:copper homeostasis protein CutC [Paenibacillus sp. WLX2291]|uniref:copper homeostasis protein CutC n=1 Tax=Paenibacillus sp. WLX2291 TaxID=3296934 RepID=UPI003984230E